MNKGINRSEIVIAFVIFTALIFAVIMNLKFTFASAPSGLSTTIATSSKLAVSATPFVAIATSTNCAARIISTTGAEIRLTFTELTGDTPSGTKGYSQAASTTVVYDGGQFGCGAVKVYSFGNSTIEATETR